MKTLFVFLVAIGIGFGMFVFTSTVSAAAPSDYGLVDGDLVKIFSLYDNEAGYTATLVEHVRRISARL